LEVIVRRQVPSDRNDENEIYDWKSLITSCIKFHQEQEKHETNYDGHSLYFGFLRDAARGLRFGFATASSLSLSLARRDRLVDRPEDFLLPLFFTTSSSSSKSSSSSSSSSLMNSSSDTTGCCFALRGVRVTTAANH